MNREDAERIAAQINERTEYRAWVAEYSHWWGRAEPPGGLTQELLDSMFYIEAEIGVEGESGDETYVDIEDKTLTAATILFDAGLIGTNEQETA